LFTTELGYPAIGSGQGNYFQMYRIDPGYTCCLNPSVIAQDSSISAVVDNLYVNVSGWKLTAVPDPATQISDLLADVTGFGPGKSLANEMTLVQTYYAVPDIAATCAVLTDFVSEVKAQTGKKIKPTDARTFTVDAQTIMGELGCH
jgi:hypothetical protein